MLLGLALAYGWKPAGTVQDPDVVVRYADGRIDEE